MGKVRESNFELLRCVLMLMVISLHYNLDLMGNAFSYVVEGSINYYFVYFMESMAIIATNVFVVLGGYFGWKSMDKMTLRKPIGLLIYVGAYNGLFYLIHIAILGYPITADAFLLSFLPKNWFVTIYAAMLILSPFVNFLMSKISKKTHDKLLIIMFVLFALYPTILSTMTESFGINTVGMYPAAGTGALSGYSIFNFIMLYMMGAALSKYNVLQHKVVWDVVAYVICSLVIMWQRLNLGMTAWSYANPFVVFSTIAFFNIFRKMHFTSKVINTLSKSSLGVLLLHMQFVVYTYGWQYFKIPMAAAGPFVGLVINVLLVCFVNYFACTFFDMFCRFITRPISKLLDKVPFLNKQIVKFDD